MAELCAFAGLIFMNVFSRPKGSAIAALLMAAALALAAGCGGKKNTVPPGTVQPDKFLYDRGIAALNDKKWFNAREYLRQVVDNYPQSPYRPDAKIGVGDSYLGEGTTEAYVLAINEFREFLTYYPTNPRADYAQFKVGYAHFKQMLGPERDQSETREAIKEFQTFVEQYPNSTLMDEGKARLREAKDRLGESDYRVGFFYFRAKWYPGAIDRFKALLKNDPGYTRRDAVYFHLAESLLKTENKAEALPYFEKLVQEFETSEYLEEAKRRISELKAGDTRGGAPPRAVSRSRLEEQGHANCGGGAGDDGGGSHGSGTNILSSCSNDLASARVPERPRMRPARDLLSACGQDPHHRLG